ARRGPTKGKPWKQPGAVTATIGTLLGRLEVKERLIELQLRDAWAEAVGDSFARRSIAIRFARGTLYVVVENAAWLNELRFSEKEILARVNAAYTARSHVGSAGSKPAKALHPTIGAIAHRPKPVVRAAPPPP